MSHDILLILFARSLPDIFQTLLGIIEIHGHLRRSIFSFVSCNQISHIKCKSVYILYHIGHDNVFTTVTTKCMKLRSMLKPTDISQVSQQF